MADPDGRDLAADADALVQRVEARLLGAPPDLTRNDVAKRCGADVADLRALWRSLGFASVGDTDRMFGNADVDAIEDMQALARAAALDDAAVRSMTRMLGQTFSRLASWQVQLLVDVLARHPQLADSAGGSPDADALDALLERALPVVERLQAYVWRRQLVAAATRVLSQPQVGGPEAVGTGTALGVGFADLTGFTSLTRRVGEAQLRELLETFESAAAEAVAGNGGRVVKALGDAVLFAVGDAAAAAATGLELLERWDAVEDVPPLCVGVAYGPVVSRFGDVFGQPVNIASRLASLARPGTVLVDRVLAVAVRDDDRFAVRPLRPEHVRGYGHLRPYRLRLRPGE